MKLMLITQLPPPTGGIASWSKNYINYVTNNTNVSLSVVNCALKGKRAENFNEKRNLAYELKRTGDSLRQVFVVVHKTKPDIVHMNSSCSPLGIIRDWACMCMIGKEIPVVLHCHCTVEDQLGKSKLGIAFFEKVVKRADRVLVLNNRSRIWIKNNFGCEAEIVPNFIGSTVINERGHIINEEIKKVLFVGHLLKSKGTCEMKLIAQKHPTVSFVFAGSYTEQEKKDLKLDNAELLGDVDHATVLRLIDEADLFLFLSHSEGFSISLLEAMARGIPVLVSDVGANLDMIENQGGIVVPAQQAEKANAGFDEMLKTTADERSRMSEWLISKVEAKYLTSIVIDDLIDIYSETIKEKKK